MKWKDLPAFLPKCGHKHPARDGRMCGAVELMPIGYRCGECAGMHHFDGTPKTELERDEHGNRIVVCTQGCCTFPMFSTPATS